MSAMQTLHFESALLPEGMANDVVITIDETGTIATVSPNATERHSSALSVSGCVLPGIANLHSHAHQRAMAGRAERSGTTPDSFWTWRNIMYGFLNAMNPEQLHAVAAQLYVEMLKAGYTRVAEFQYLHHQPGGQPYTQLAEMSLQTLQAAQDVGLGITCLPVHYQYAGFNRQPVGEQQRRFYNTPDRFLRIVDALKKTTHAQTNSNVGIALHSLRAVDVEAFNEINTSGALTGDIPIHLHIAEQLKEVDDCLDWCGARPVEHLLDQFPIDSRWCLVHATHMTTRETQQVAQSGAVAGLCPTTEANLGDGLFNATDYRDASGAFGIGSDSHISVSPVEELRWLEYGQRLLKHSRNELSGGGDSSTGRHLVESSAIGGNQACGHTAGRLEAGRRADFIVLNTHHPLLCERKGEDIIDSWVFSGNEPVVRDVYVGGVRVINDGHHADEELIQQRFASTLKQLSAML